MAESFSGRDLGRRIFVGLRAYVARSQNDLRAQMEALQSAVQSVMQNTPTLEIMRGEIDAAIVNRMPAPQEIAAPTPEDFRPMLEAELAKWALDFERRAQATLERAIDRMPAPKDGTDGEPGANIEDFLFTMEGRVVTLALNVGGRIQSKSVRFDFPIERGVYQAGKAYEKSDIVTFSGSQFIATRDTTEKEKPEASPAWRLIVKRGRDGKDGEGAQ